MSSTSFPRDPQEGMQSARVRFFVVRPELSDPSCYCQRTGPRHFEDSLFVGAQQVSGTLTYYRREPVLVMLFDQG